ncbi:MAG: type I restriction endonuclease subunit R [Chloroflexota bacterium]|nr:type I restriction endonuclease subunit R [Chloroflexota bacterium]
MPAGFTESVVEEAGLEWLAQIGWSVCHGPDVAPGEPAAERTDYREVVLPGRLQAAINRLNPAASSEAQAEAIRRVTQPDSPSLIQANRAVHKFLVEGVPVEVLRNGEPRGELVRLIDFDHPANNDWLAVNQFTVVESLGGSQVERRPDVVLFVNGLPLAVVEFKNTADPKTTIDTAWKQLQTYQAQIPRLFHSNELLVISDGAETQIGCLTTPRERFAAWKTVDGDELLPSATLDVAIKGIFDHGRFLDLVRSFVVFEDDGKTLTKKIAQYHQFHAVRKALKTALAASSAEGDGKGGVLWHTQGSGKSLTMLFFAGKLIAHPALANPTVVLLTDRTDLDNQLFDTFAAGKDLLRQTPVQAGSRAHLRDLLRVNAGGVVFTTIQKFFPNPDEEDYPLLSDRRNVVVMADEAHRTQYGFGTRLGQSGAFVRGFAAHMRDALPNATFVAFTGTPLELADKDTRLVFGDYIDVYDVGRAIADGATVPIFYESRLIKLDLPEDQAGLLDDEFEEITEGEETQRRDKLASRWSQLEAVVGTPKRLAQVAADLVEHVNRRQEALAGKVMVVAMSRRIAVDLHDRLVALRPDWHGGDDATGQLKVIMTGSASDDLAWQPHIRNKQRRDKLADRFKDPDDPFRVAIVRDMWLTGFDAPALHTIYLDKPMRGHGLMQAIARVNRVFRDKPGGLVVDYLGLADNLKAALRAYVVDRPDGASPAKPVENDELKVDQLVAAMVEQLELCRDAFRGFDYGLFLTGTPSERLAVVAQAQDFLVLRNFRERGEGVYDRFIDHATALAKAFALASATDEAQRIKTEIAFFQTVKAALAKVTGRGDPGRDETLDHAIRQLVDRAIAPEGVVDIFAAAGLDKPDISGLAILSDGFLAEVQGMPQRNLALELLRKLLNDEITASARTNAVQSRRFSEKLEESINRYHNRALETAQVIEALIDLAREMRDANARGDRLGLATDELAFYDALGANRSAQEVLGDAQLRDIAREIADTVRQNVTIDWTKRENARANLRRLVRRALRRHGYPPDRQDAATRLVIDQAELLAREGTGPAPLYRG